MIELNKKTQQDFLNREWVQRLRDAGVDMSDAKYCIARMSPNEEVIALNSEFQEGEEGYYSCVPTYTVSELLYKLHEWIYPEIDGVKYSGGLKMTKDAPFYPVWYDLQQVVEDEEGNAISTDNKIWDYIASEAEYPIESLASILIQCHQKDIGMANPDTGNISSK